MLVEQLVLDIVCRSGDGQFEVSVAHRQSSAVKKSVTSDDAVNPTLSADVSSSQQGVGKDLAQQLQRTVRNEMRRIMEVQYRQLTFNNF